MIEKTLLITKLIDAMELIRLDLMKAQGTNKLATRRSRTKLVAFEKMAKQYRKTTIALEKE